MEELKYPIGKLRFEKNPDMEEIKVHIAVLRELPGKLRDALEGLTEEQLETSYREGGWTIRQVVHHIADSHMNSLIRIKLALTEENPLIKPYREDKWAELSDYKETTIEDSLQMISLIHKKLVVLLENMNEKDFQRTYFHPDENRTFKLAEVAALYDWHSRHHLAHITKLKERMNW